MGAASRFPGRRQEERTHACWPCCARAAPPLTPTPILQLYWHVLLIWENWNIMTVYLRCPNLIFLLFPFHDLHNAFRNLYTFKDIFRSFEKRALKRITFEYRASCTCTSIDNAIALQLRSYGHFYWESRNLECCQSKHRLNFERKSSLKGFDGRTANPRRKFASKSGSLGKMQWENNIIKDVWDRLQLKFHKNNTIYIFQKDHT